MEKGAELHYLAKMTTNKLNLLLCRDVWIVNDRMLLNFKDMVKFRRRSQRHHRGLVFLFFLCQKLNDFLNILAGVQEVMVAIATKWKRRRGWPWKYWIDSLLIKIKH